VPLVEAGVVAHLDGVGRRAAAIGPVVQQAVNPPALSRLLAERTGGSDPGPPPGPAGPIPGSSTPEAIPTRGRDPDGTQSGVDKPVPLSMPSGGGPSAGGAAGATGATGAAAAGAAGAAAAAGVPLGPGRPEQGGARRG
jgi:hypothetical protein